jgi:hypothetical protein
MTPHVAVHQELAAGERIPLHGCADQFGGIRTHRQPTESVGQGLLGRGGDEDHHPFRFHRTTGAVHVPGPQDVQCAHGQQPLQVAQIREVRPSRLHTVRTHVRQTQPLLHAFGEEVRQAPAVLRHVAVQARRMTPYTRTPSGAGATEPAHPARLRPPAHPANAARGLTVFDVSLGPKVRRT